MNTNFAEQACSHNSSYPCNVCPSEILDQQRCQMFCTKSMGDMVLPSSKWGEIADSVDRHRCRRRHRKNGFFCTEHGKTVVDMFGNTVNELNALNNPDMMMKVMLTNPDLLWEKLSHPYAWLGVPDAVFRTMFMYKTMVTNDSQFVFVLNFGMKSLSQMFDGKMSNFKMYLAYRMIDRLSKIVVSRCHPMYANMIQVLNMGKLMDTWVNIVKQAAPRMTSDTRAFMDLMLTRLFAAFKVVVDTSSNIVPRPDVFSFSARGDTEDNAVQSIMNEIAELDLEEKEEPYVDNDSPMKQQDLDIYLGSLKGIPVGKKVNMQKVPPMPQMPLMSPLVLNDEN